MKKYLLTKTSSRNFKGLSLLFLSTLFTLISFAQTSWKGTTSTYWSNAANWTNGVPDELDDVTIGDANFTGANQPKLTTVGLCKSLIIGGTKTATLTANYNLTVTNGVTIKSNGTLSSSANIRLGGDWLNSGTYSASATSSQVTFAGSSQIIGGSNVTTFTLLNINAGSTVTLNRNLIVSGYLSRMTIDGIFDPSDAPTYLATISDLTINNGGTLRINAATYMGNYSITGSVALNPGFIVEYSSSTIAQSVTNLLAYSTLKISGSSVKTIPGAISFQSSASNVGNLYLAGGTLDIGANTISRGTTVAGGILSVSDGATLRMGGTNSFPTGFSTVALGAASTIEYNGSGQTIPSRSFGNLAITGAGTKTAGGPLTIAGDLTLNTATFVAGSYTHTIAGDWNMTSGILTNTGSTVTFNGSSAQSLSSTGAFNNVIINKAAGDLTLATDMTVNALTFTKGLITTGAKTVIVSGTGTVSGAAQTTGWVNGRLQKYFSAAAGGNFDVGGKIYYSPCSVSFASITTPGSLIISATAASHPHISTSTISTNNISRYWTVSKPATSPIAYTNANFTFTWNVADNYPGLKANKIIVGNYNGSSWTYPANAGGGTTTIQAKSVTTQGDFAVGETAACTISSAFSYGATSLCSNGGSANITLNAGATAGTFTATPSGLSLNAATGAINLSLSTPNVYVIKNTAINGGCTSVSTFTVDINQAASATIAYPTSLCTSGIIANVILTGTTGGVFSSSSPASLPVNGSTGQLDLANSKAGTYTITYTVAGDVGCSNFTTTASVTITDKPTASFSYPGSPFCSGSSTATVAANGATGGVYSSTTGLSINATTGTVDLIASTPGTYTVTYTIAAANGCTTFSTTASINIISKPTVSITYSSPALCTGAGTASATITGLTGGVFSCKSSGLVLDQATGAIDLSASTPGTYTISYTVSQGGSCTTVATTTVTITAAPTATIAYPGSSFCQNGGNLTPTITGTSTGLFTVSPAGLSINSATGVVTLSSSSVGSYTITYTVAASGGCSSFTATASLSVVPRPTASFSYSASSFCANSTNPTVTRTGTAGGSYSSTPGLSIDALTGTINLAASTPNTYTVTYTVGSGSCTATATANVTITAAPTATITYAGGPFCPSAGTMSVTRTGTAGGTYTITGGLTIDASTGDITPTTTATGTYTVTYSIAASGGCSAFTTTTTVVISKASWTGAISTDWNDDHNWSCNHHPDDKTAVIIPAGLTNYPVITSDKTVKSFDLTVQSGATLTVIGTLQLVGSITASNNILSDSGSIEMIGSAAQVIPANVFVRNELEDLTVNNNTGVTLNGALAINDILTITKGALTTNNYLTLKSSTYNTARVAAIASSAANPIIGNVTVERYVPGRRKYRLITSSVTTSTRSTLSAADSTLSIWGNWQNAGVAIKGVGTIITGGTTANGFDQGSANASLYTYNSSTKKFVAYTSANGKNTKQTPLVAGVPYYMFIYGDRTNSLASTNPNPTVLRETGTLVTGSVTVDGSSATPISSTMNAYSMVGNPYAAIVDWKAVQKKSVSNTIWGWDANLSSTGGFVTVTSTLLSTLISPLSNAIKINQFVQPGQAFFVQTTGANPSVTFNENSKVDSRTNINSNVFRTAINATPLLAVNLLYSSAGTLVLADGSLAAFDDSFSKDVTDDDGVKMPGTTEGLAIIENGNTLGIDSRPMPQDKDTLFLNVSKLTKPQYTLEIFSQQLASSPVQPFLEDAYLKTSTALSLTDTNRIVFNVDANAASSDINRFRIVFNQALSTLPVTFTSIKATEKNKNIQVEWNVVNEDGIKKYEVERSVDGTNFSKVSEVVVKGTNNSSYSWLDVNAAQGNNYYRIKAVQPDGQYFYSKVDLVTINGGKAGIRVYPNPVKDQQINLQLNSLEKGQYSLVIFNAKGQQVFAQEFNHTGGSTTKTINLNSRLPYGMFYVEITNSNAIYHQTIMVE